MPNVGRSMNSYYFDVKNENRSISIEMASVLSFLMGLALAMLAVWFLALTFAISIVPEDRASVPGEDFFPQLNHNPWLVAIGISGLVLPAIILMSAGVVVRYFFEKGGE